MKNMIISIIINFFSKKIIIIIVPIIFIVYLLFIISTFPESKKYEYYVDIEKDFNDWKVLYLSDSNYIAMCTRDKNLEEAALISIFDIKKYDLQIPTNQKNYTFIELSKNLFTKLPYNKPFDALINFIQNPNIQLLKDSTEIIFYDKYTGRYNDILFDILNTKKELIEISIPESDITLIFSTFGDRDAYEYIRELYKDLIQSKEKYEKDYMKWLINLVVFISVFCIFSLFYIYLFIIQKRGQY